MNWIFIIVSIIFVFILFFAILAQAVVLVSRNSVIGSNCSDTSCLKNKEASISEIEMLVETAMERQASSWNERPHDWSI